MLLGRHVKISQSEDPYENKMIEVRTSSLAYAGEGVLETSFNTIVAFYYGVRTFDTDDLRYTALHEENQSLLCYFGT